MLVKCIAAKSTHVFWGCLTNIVSIDLKYEGISENYSGFVIFMERNDLLTSLSPVLCAFSSYWDNHFVLKCDFVLKTK